MSRLRRLKEKTRKNTIKTTMASLALVLAIGSTQVIGTYALFTDNVDVSSDLSISTGDVDVSLDGSFNKTEVKPGDIIKDTFTISNNGTLKQTVSLKLEADLDIKNYLTYSINFDRNIIKPIKDLQNIEQNLLLNDGTDNLFILNPGESIKANVTVTVGEIPKELSEEPRNLYLEVLAKQINYNYVIDKGFYDIEGQMSTIAFGKQSDVISWENGLKYAGNGSDNDFITIDFNNHYPDMGKFDGNINIEILETNGQFEKNIATVQRDNGNTFTIQLNKDTDPSKFSDDFNGTDVIVLQFNYYDGKYIKVHFDFRRNPNASGNKMVEAKYTIIDTGYLQNNKDVEESLKEEVLSSNEVEVVDSHKEEVEGPNQPEVVEPPKVEETIVPSKPDIIDPSKEEIEIQE